MSADLKRFHATFFEESREGLDAMEAGLLSLEEGNRDPETINSVFRAAHSIKGGAATFGFEAMAGLTHVLETLLDELRSAGALSAATRFRLAARAFAHTAAYDGEIGSTLAGKTGDFPAALEVKLNKVHTLRYGENPHQRGALYVERGAPMGIVATARFLQGKELS